MSLSSVSELDSLRRRDLPFRPFRHVPGACAAILITLGLGVLLSHVWGSSFWAHTWGGSPAPSIPGGIAFFVLGLALALLRHPESSWAQTRLGQGLAWLLVVAALSGGFDHVLRSLCLGSAGLSLLLLNRRSASGRSWSQHLALLLGFVSLGVLMGYAFQVKPIYGVAPYTQLSLLSSLAFGVAAIGLLLARTDQGFMATVNSSRIGGFVARRLMVAAVVLPFLLGMLDQAGERAGFYDQSYGLTIFVLANVGVLLALIWRYAHSLNFTDARRRQVEDELRRSREYFRSLADSIPQIVWTAGMDGEVDYFNRRWEEYTGQDGKDGWRPVMHPEDRPRSRQRWEHAIQTSQPYEIEYRFRRERDGAYRWFLGRALPHRDEHGNIVKWFGTCTDIDDQKREKEFQTFLAQASDILNSTWDAQVTLTTLARLATGLLADWCMADLVQNGQVHRVAVTCMNPLKLEQARELERMAAQPNAPGGTPLALNLGRSIFRSMGADADLIGSADPAHVKLVRELGAHSYITVLIRDAATIVGALTFVSGDSRRSYTEGDLRLLEKIARRAGYSIERARLSREKNETIKLLDTLLEAAPAGFAFLNTDLQLMRVNRSFSNLLGQPPEKILGRHMREILPALSPLVEPIIRRVLATGKPVENFNIGEEARSRHWLVSYYPIPGDQGRPVGVGIVTVDITDNKQTEFELKAAKDEAEAASRAKSAFLANMSHEIRTPLGAMLGFAELLLYPNLSPAERAEFVFTIKRNGDQLTKLVDDILDLSKVEAGRMQIEDIEFDLAELVQEISALLTPQARKKGINLHVDLSPNLPARIKTDPLRLRQVLLNILGNSVKFTERGEVRVGVQMSDPVPGLDRARMVFTVRDTGIGISSGQQKHLFQPFSQADNSTTRQFGGTGLGLVLARRLCRLMGGDLTLVSSAPGQGSVFRMTIEAGLVKDQTKEADVFDVTSLVKPSVKNMLHGVNILVVEDSQDNQFLVELFLKSAGAQVDIAGDGVQGVTRALEGSHDLVLMDIQMPLLDGYEATRTLRERGYTKPIIALTAHALNEERERALTVGCNDHVTKPIDRVHLVQKIREHLPSRPTADEGHLPPPPAPDYF